MRIPRVLLVVAIGSVMPGCASFVAPPYSPDYETLDSFRKMAVEKLAVGEVQPNNLSAPVNLIKLRGAPLSATGGTYAKYLEDAIRSDLREMGLFDPASTTRIEATILKNDIDISGITTGYGVMEVKLAVTKKGVTAFEKVYKATTEFESSFAGAVAIPKGQSEYPNLVRTLLRKVYSDPAFIKTVSK